MAQTWISWRQDYIVVLLKRDNSEIELKNACENELVDFLGVNTNQFVRKMFNAIRDGIFDAELLNVATLARKEEGRTILTTRQSVLKVTMYHWSLDYGGATWIHLRWLR